MSELPDPGHMPEKPTAVEQQPQQLIHILAERGPDGKTIPIDTYLLSPDGRRDVREFVEPFDGMHDLTSHLLYKFKETAQSRRPADADSFLARLVALNPQQGLNRAELQALFMENPVIDKLLQSIQRARHEGALDTPKQFNNIMLVMMNIVKAEALNGTHDPHDKKWGIWAKNLRYRDGNEHILNHKGRLNPETRVTGQQQ